MLRVLSVLLGCFLLIVAGSFLTSSASPVTSRDATYEPPPNAVETVTMTLPAAPAIAAIVSADKRCCPGGVCGLPRAPYLEIDTLSQSQQEVTVAVSATNDTSRPVTRRPVLRASGCLTARVAVAPLRLAARVFHGRR